MLSQLFFSLQQLDLMDETVVAVFSDHGESLGERGYVGHSQLYQKQLKIPLLVYFPGHRPQLRPEPVEVIDLMPSILELVNIQPPASAQGIDLHLADSSAGTFPANRARLTETTDEAFSTDEEWSLILRDKPENDELYYLSVDPEETVNLRDSSVDRLDIMRRAYEEKTGKDLAVSRTEKKEIYQSDMIARKRLMPARGSQKESASQEKFESELRALGYLN